MTHAIEMDHIMCAFANWAGDANDIIVAFDDDARIITVRIDDDDERTYCACMLNDDEARYEFQHASFDDRIVIRFNRN